MSSISSRKLDAASRSRVAALDSWSMALVERAMRTCIFTLRKVPHQIESSNVLILYRGPDPNEVQKAKELCEDLLKNVREHYEEFKSRPQRGYGGQTTGYGGERGYGDRPDRSNSYGGYGGYNNSAPNSGVLSPTTPSAPGAGSPPPGTDYTAQYAQYYAASGGADPYAAYGKLRRSS